eukprot:TRINITY_DN14886_c0_g1_i1.p2 TRINITY_DN14886_c0_g1~~TRINITY_DN14886_c0_g1_i1.p2  ORF type:complete len:108 (-),score=4.51 TRINITY_DN14886_c0_g1_i1:290-613(-)
MYLNENFSHILGDLDPSSTLGKQLEASLSRKVAPIWMDRSTRVECCELQTHFKSKLQLETGSPATERFTGPQIRKFSKDDPVAWLALFQLPYFAENRQLLTMEMPLE